MRRLLSILLAALAFCGAQAKEATPMAEDPVVERRLLAISEEMRCLVCQNESLAGSRSELANDLRREVRTMIRDGKTDAQIRDFMVARYGDFVLYRPPVRPATYLLWVGPFLILVVAVGALLLHVRRRAQTLPEGETP